MQTPISPTPQVLLPRAWDFSQCGAGRAAAYRQAGRRPHVRVVEGAGPAYSLQHRGCGERGLGLVLPLGLLSRHPAEVKTDVSKAGPVAVTAVTAVT
jgi:hypothetical protein